MGRLAAALGATGTAMARTRASRFVPSGVSWCNANTTSKHPNFRFTLADIYNREYNPTGLLSAAEYRFPYPDDTFDLVVLISVFTHMLPAEMEHYVAEISRVLKREGKCFATYSLLDGESLRTMEAGESQRRFTSVGPHWVVDTKVPELAVAYEESFVRNLYQRYGHSCNVHYGTWSGRPTPPDDPPRFDQDFVLTTKGDRAPRAQPSS